VIGGSCPMLHAGPCGRGENDGPDGTFSRTAAYPLGNSGADTPTATSALRFDDGVLHDERRNEGDPNSPPSRYQAAQRLTEMRIDLQRAIDSLPRREFVRPSAGSAPRNEACEAVGGPAGIWSHDKVRRWVMRPAAVEVGGMTSAEFQHARFAHFTKEEAILGLCCRRTHSRDCGGWFTGCGRLSTVQSSRLVKTESVNL